MANYYMLGPEHQNMHTFIISGETAFPIGPHPGSPGCSFIMNFTNVVYIWKPHIVASTSNPHYTVHPIWTQVDSAGFSLSRKTTAPGGGVVTIYYMAIGCVRAVKGQWAEPKIEITQVTEDELEEIGARKADKNL